MIRNSLVPLLKLVDRNHKGKVAVEDTVDVCGAVVIPKDNADAKFEGWVKETVSPVLTIDTINKRAQALLKANYEIAEKQLKFLAGIVTQLCKQLFKI